MIDLVKMSTRIEALRKCLEEFNDQGAYERGMYAFSAYVSDHSANVHVQAPLYEYIKGTTEGCKEKVRTLDNGDVQKTLICDTLKLSFTCVVFKDERL